MYGFIYLLKKKFMNNFKILVAHWAKNKDRFDYLSDLFSSCPHELLFFSKYDRENLSVEEKNLLSDKMTEKVTISEACNYLNHLSCMKYINENLEYGLILEDDMICNNDENLLNNLNKIKDYFYTNNYDLGFCGGSTLYPSFYGVQEQDSKYFYDIQDTRCVDAYFVSKNGAKIILDDLMNNKINQALDWALKSTIVNKNLKVFHTYPMDFMIQGSLFGYYKSTAQRDR